MVFNGLLYYVSAIFFIASVQAYKDLGNGAVEGVPLNPDTAVSKITLKKDVKKIGKNDRNAIGDQARWPKGVVPYKFDSSLSDLAKKAVMAAIADFEKFTCVRFVPRTNQPNYLTILNDGNGCWSYVGMTRGAQQLGLSEGCETKGTALHELMHALGFDHEHSRPDRGKFIIIDTQNIEPGFADQFDITEGAQLFGIAYDFGSIMHYDKTSFSKSDKPTMRRVDGKPLVTQTKGLSDYDVKAINIYYKNCAA